MIRQSPVARWLSDRRAPLWAAAIALLVLSPTLAEGLQLDDNVHKIVLDSSLRLPGMRGSPFDAFTFVADDDAARKLLVDRAHGPWWASPDLVLAFFRPLSSLTHWADYALWPMHPALMHLQSLLWYGALVLLVGALHRRLAGPGPVAGLATILFALDDAHALPAGWLANRNGTIAAVFACLALLAHDRWRRGSSRAAAVGAPVAFVLGLLSGEAAVAVLGYLAAYALFVDPAPPWRRALALAPYAALTLGWGVVYRTLGYGARGSGLYLDPLGEPAAYLRAAVARAPILLGAEVGLVPSDVAAFISGAALVALALGSVALLGLLVSVLAPALRRDPVIRFALVGMALSVAPACATFPMDRLLLFVGIGGSLLIARVIADFAARPAGAEARPRGARALALFFVAVHVVLGPLLLLPRAYFPSVLGHAAQRVAASVPHDEALRSQTLVIVNTSDVISSTYPLVTALASGKIIAARQRCLAVSASPFRATRKDDTTLVLRSDAGFFDSLTDPLVRPRDRAFARGYRLELTGLTIEVTDLTPAGRPSEVVYRFAMPLEDPSLRWITWSHGQYVPFVPPAIGEERTVEGARMEDML